MQPRLMRSESDKMFAGVCGGLAQYLGVDPVLVRLAFVLLIFSAGIGFPLYLVLMIIMPKESDLDQSQVEIIEKNVGELGETVESGVKNMRQHPQGPMIAAVLLILMGVYFLLQNLGVSFLNSSLLLPLLLIGLGIYLVVRRSRT